MELEKNKVLNSLINTYKENENKIGGIDFYLDIFVRISELNQHLKNYIKEPNAVNKKKVITSKEGIIKKYKILVSSPGAYLLDLGEDKAMEMKRSLILENENISIKINELNSFVNQDNDNLLIENINFNDSIELPTNLLIGETTHNTNSKDNIDSLLNSSLKVEDLSLDLVNNGNVFIDYDEYIFSEGVDNVINAYIMSIFKAFPTGKVNIVIVDPEDKFQAYYQYNNALSNGTTDSKKSFTLINDIDELFKFNLDNKRNDISKTFINGTKDFYDLYLKDSNHAMTFVLFLSGFVENVTNISRKAKLIQLLNNTGLYHKCGIRVFAIDSLESKGPLKAINEEDINIIKNNFEYVFKYRNNEFTYNNSNCALIHTSKNVTDFVEETLLEVKDRLNSLKKVKIPYKDIGFGLERGSSKETCYNIAIGYSNKKPYYLPLSCCSDDTDRGSIIGHMVIGNAGRGKSSILDAFIINGGMKYSPKELEFWILDFKSNSLAQKYVTFGIPHVTRIAPASRPDDAFSLLTELKNQITIRNNLFNEVGKKYNVSFANVAQYNEFAINHDLEILPRIVLCIDEIQELFNGRNEFNQKNQERIKSIVDMGRSTGVHLFLIAQSITDESDLKDIFLTQKVSRISFGQNKADTLLRSGYGEAFENNVKSVLNLGLGECYISLGPNSFDLVRVAFESSEDLKEHFNSIKERYPEQTKVLKIGDTSRLDPEHISPVLDKNFFDLLLDDENKVKRVEGTIGENYFNLLPQKMIFDRTICSCGMILGSDQLLSSSIMTSLLVSIARQGYKTYMVDGRHDETLPFGKMYQNLNVNNVIKIPTRKIIDILDDLYYEHQKRLYMIDENIQDDLDPIFIFIDEYQNIERIKSGTYIDSSSHNKKASNESNDEFIEESNEIVNSTNEESNDLVYEKIQSNIESKIDDYTSEDGRIDVDNFFDACKESYEEDEFSIDLSEIDALLEDNKDSLDNAMNSNNSSEDTNKNSLEGEINYDSISVQNALLELMLNGRKTNIFVICSSSTDNTYNFAEIVTNTRNLVIFNNLVSSNIPDGADAREILMSVANPGYQKETIALARANGQYVKFRPIIYSKDEQLSELEKIGGSTNE